MKRYHMIVAFVAGSALGTLFLRWALADGKESGNRQNTGVVDFKQFRFAHRYHAGGILFDRCRSLATPFALFAGFYDRPVRGHLFHQIVGCKTITYGKGGNSWSLVRPNHLLAARFYNHQPYPGYYLGYHARAGNSGKIDFPKPQKRNSNFPLAMFSGNDGHWHERSKLKKLG